VTGRFDQVLRAARPREPGHQHAEAFCLMWYACPCGHRERIWNSRDGVTPFGTLCPSCGQPDLKHVSWNQDAYARDHMPAIGQRQWVSMTPAAAERIADLRTAAAALRGYPVPPEHRAQFVAAIYHDGLAPNLVVTGYEEAGHG
jgi:hypothetical protein